MADPNETEDDDSAGTGDGSENPESDAATGETSESDTATDEPSASGEGRDERDPGTEGHQGSQIEPGASAAGGREEPNTLLNALIGAAVTVVFSFIPFSPLLGGAVAGYLQGEEFGRDEYEGGAKVGAVSGLFAMIPLTLLVFLAVIFLAFVPVGVALGILFLFLFVLLFMAVYTIGLSALGGVLGVYAKSEADL